MAFIHGKDTKVYIDSNDLSSYLSSADPSRTVDVGETTTFGSSNKTYVAGEKDAYHYKQRSDMSLFGDI